MLELFQELFGELGRPLDAATYERELAGMSDPEIMLAWLGRESPAAAQVIAERDRRYRARTADGSTIPNRCGGGAAGRRARAGRGLLRRGAERDLLHARRRRHRGLDRLIVAAEDVPRGKPAPDGYAEAHRRLAPELPAGAVLAFEDTEVGIASALAAGMRCIAVLGTMRADRLAAAERIVPSLDSAVVAEALGREHEPRQRINRGQRRAGA